MSYKFNIFTGRFDLVEPVTIGKPVIAGTPSSVLFIDGSGNLAENNPGLTYDGNTLTVEEDDGGGFGDVGTALTTTLQSNQYGPASEVRHTTKSGAVDGELKISNHNSDSSVFSYLSLYTDLLTYHVGLNEIFGANESLFYVRTDSRHDDGKKAYYGSDKDASVQHDGTDLVINPREIGNGKLRVRGTVEVPAGQKIIHDGVAL